MQRDQPSVSSPVRTRTGDMQSMHYTPISVPPRYGMPDAVGEYLVLIVA